MWQKIVLGIIDIIVIVGFTLFGIWNIYYARKSDDDATLFLGISSFLGAALFGMFFWGLFY